MPMGTLCVTSMVEFHGAGGIAGVNMPVDGTGPSKEAGYWVAQSAGLTGGVEDCHASCGHLMPVGGAGSAAVSSGPGKSRNMDIREIRDWGPSEFQDAGMVGMGVGVLSFGAGVGLLITPLAGGAPVGVIAGMSMFALGSVLYTIGVGMELMEGAEGSGGQEGRSASLGGLSAYLACVNRFKYGEGGPFDDGSGAGDGGSIPTPTAPPIFV